jgi:hypothetical protein
MGCGGSKSDETLPMPEAKIITHGGISVHLNKICIAPGSDFS